jgi:5-amino-6-(5-phosphoribosylamino)uracil reductase
MKTTLVLAMTADGKISDVKKSPPTFGSKRDYAHLEEQIMLSDVVLVGSGTLKDGGGGVEMNPELIQARLAQGKSAQPPQIICSRSGDIDPTLPFFSQPNAIADGKPFERWLLTTKSGAVDWLERTSFDRVLVCETADGKDIDWQAVKVKLAELAVENICFLGGAELAASLFAANFIDELWLTICPFIYGGSAAPSPVAGTGFTPELAPRLTLLSVERVDQELFLHYQVQ